MGQILDTSLTVLVWRRFYKWYDLEQRIAFVCRDSRTFGLTKALWEGLKTCVRYSFLGRISEIKEPNPALLNNSRAVRYLIDFYNRWKGKITYYSKNSSTIDMAKDTKRELYLSTARTIGIIIVTAILVNVGLSIILHKEIGLWGWLMRGLFLFAGVAGLFCQADWRTVKESSRLLRKME